MQMFLYILPSFLNHKAIQTYKKGVVLNSYPQSNPDHLHLSLTSKRNSLEVCLQRSELKTLPFTMP